MRHTIPPLEQLHQCTTSYMPRLLCICSIPTSSFLDYDLSFLNDADVVGADEVGGDVNETAAGDHQVLVVPGITGSWGPN